MMDKETNTTGYRDKVVNTRDKSIPKEAALIKEVKDRFDMVLEFDSTNRTEALDDLNMLAGRNHWPGEVVRKRAIEGRPVLTVNKLPSYTDQVKNISRMNKIRINVRPNGGGSTPELSDTLEGLIRNIEEVSNAESAYQTALDGSVDNGFGYFRVVTEYSEDTSFDQDIRIRRIKNPMSVYYDPYCNEADGSDAQFCIVSELIDRKEYRRRYPGKPDPEPIGTQENPWVSADRVRVAEYWVKEPDTKRLYLLSDGRTVDGDDWDSIEDDMKAQSRFPGAPPVPTVIRERKVETHKVVQYLVDGSKIIDGPNEWSGKYIPIIPVWGKEIIIDEERILRGLIRFAKDPQKMYDYFRTAATETVALAPKAPYIMDERQIEGHEDSWGSIGKSNLPYLLYKSVPGVPPPTRQVVTQTAIGEMTESNLANDEMKATTSLFDASLGAQGNEISGKAIQARQYRGDIANFTFHDNLVNAIRYCGRILVDLIPKIYDTRRQVITLGLDGTEKAVLINQVVVDAATGKKVIVNDLSQGRYKVTVTTGPSFATQRAESVNSMLDFMRVAPESAGLIIDLVAENMDWPGAAKIAKRFKKMLPQGIDDDGPAPPPQPSVDDVIKELKAQSIYLGNEIKKLKVVGDRRDLTGHDQQMAEGGARGAINALTGNTQGQGTGGPQ